MLSRDSRRKVALHVTGASKKSEQGTDAAPTASVGAGEVSASDAGAQADDKPETAVAAEQNDDVDMKPVEAEDVQLIQDVWAFKRSQMLYPCMK